MSLFKLSLLLSSSTFFHLGLGRCPSLDADDKVMVTSIRERIWRHVGVPSELFLKAVTWSATAGEAAVILTSLRHTPRSPGTLLDVLGPPEASKLTIPFVLGASLVIVGGYARFISFRVLGPYYTFIQCLRKEHKLVTRGPYAVVRHPGYSGLLLCIIGWGLVHGTPGSWLRMSGVLRMVWVRVSLVPTCLLMAACIVTVFRRSADEDRYLSHKFGEEWNSWASKVKYKLIPFIY